MCKDEDNLSAGTEAFEVDLFGGDVCSVSKRSARTVSVSYVNEPRHRHAQICSAVVSPLHLRFLLFTTFSVQNCRLPPPSSSSPSPRWSVDPG